MVSAAGTIFFRNGSLRCALVPEKKMPAPDPSEHRCTAEFGGSLRAGCLSTEVKRTAGSHEGDKSPGCRLRVRNASFCFPIPSRRPRAPIPAAIPGTYTRCSRT
jgi:hypothetical protein